MIVLFSCRLASVRFRQVFLHTARRLVRNIHLLEYDGLRKYPMTEVTAVERHVFPFPELNAFVEHKQFQLGIQEKPAMVVLRCSTSSSTSVKRTVSEFQATVETSTFRLKGGIGHEHVPLRWLVFEKSCPLQICEYTTSNPAALNFSTNSLCSVSNGHQMILFSGIYLMMGSTPYPGVYFSSVGFLYSSFK